MAIGNLLRYLVGLALIGLAIPAQAQPRISEDRDLKEWDLSKWDCLDRLEGTAKTPDGMERNRGKNRSADKLARAAVPEMDTAAFLKHVSSFDAQTVGKRRKDLTAPQLEQLAALEKQVVSFTGYLVLAYAGPPESTNCGSVDMHDWHLEVFEKPSNHAPQIGDPTPIICEITPRTQNGIFRDKIRLQALTGFFRAPDLTVEPTGHRAHRIRLTGYLLWDDDHNGKADIGTTIEAVGKNGYHHPWRSTPWEIHPVVKIEALDGPATSAPSPSLPPAVAAPIVSVPLPGATPPPPQENVTIVEAVRIKIQYGQTVLPPGLKLPLVSRNAQTVTVRYMGQAVTLPLQSTDLR